MSERKWVFDHLVKDPAVDIKGLIAYALYKAHKAEIAKAKREEGESDDEIEAAVRSFHQNVVDTVSLQHQYRDQAGKLITALTSKIEEEVRSVYQKEVKVELDAFNRKMGELEKKNKTLEKEKKAEQEKAVSAFIDKVAQQPNRSRLRRIACWQWNGFSGIFAAAITAIIIGGLVYVGMPDDEKKAHLQSAVTEFFSKF